MERKIGSDLTTRRRPKRPRRRDCSVVGRQVYPKLQFFRTTTLLLNTPSSMRSIASHGGQCDCYVFLCFTQLACQVSSRKDQRGETSADFDLVAHTTPLRAGQPSVIMRRFELEPLLANIEKFQINEIGLVPPIIIAIIMSGLASKYSLKGIKSLTCGAAPLGRESQDRMRDLLAPGTFVNQVWGMTETSCIASIFYCPEDDVTGSVGRMLPGLDAKYVLSL